MENHRFSKTIFLNFSHLPTLLLVIGYPVYWLELYVIRRGEGQTSLLAGLIFILAGVFVLYQNKERLEAGWKNLKDDLYQENRFAQVFFLIGSVLTFLIFLCAFKAALLPPHLAQEHDALNYHITLPRQHLLTGSFQHIAWSTSDLFPLPVQFALAPYWLVTWLPNKLPQLLFLVGLLLIVTNLMKYNRNSRFLNISLVIFAIVGSHSVGIQMGTAMLDIVLCYLFLACIESFMQRAYTLAAIELTFFFWSKPLLSLQFVFIIFIIFTITVLIKKLTLVKTISFGFGREVEPGEMHQYRRIAGKVLPLFLVLSIFIGGPFLWKSTYYSGTPVYPLGPGIITINNNVDKASEYWNDIVVSAESHMAVKDSYGYGRSLKNWIKHLWLIAVPDEGVNNKFDYPLGLPYLVFVGPFLYFVFCSLKRKQYPIIPISVMIIWGAWWFGSQQSRFLYIPLILMFMTVACELKKPSAILKVVVLCALVFNLTAVFRAHKDDFGKTRKEILREKDLSLIALSKTYHEEKRNGTVQLPFGDVAFARFPVNVTKEQLPHIIVHD